MGYDEEGKLSKFNAGVAQTERLDSLQRAINMARFNPLSMNMDTGTYNYQVMINANDCLLNECWAKLKKDEKTYGDRIKLLVHQTVELYPPVTYGKDGAKVNVNNYKKFMEVINIYEKTTKTFLDTHNLNSPNVDDDEGL